MILTFGFLNLAIRRFPGAMGAVGLIAPQWRAAGGKRCGLRKRGLVAEIRRRATLNCGALD